MVWYQLDRWYDRLRFPRRWLSLAADRVDRFSLIVDALANSSNSLVWVCAMSVLLGVAVAWCAWLWLRQVW